MLSRIIYKLGNMYTNFKTWVDFNPEFAFVPRAVVLLNILCITSYFFVPDSLLYFSDNRIWSMPWTPVGSLFAHGDIYHLYSNMLMLSFFGYHVEKKVGSFNFLRLFVFSGVVSMVGWGLLYPEEGILGCSGAIAGIAAISPITIDRRAFRWILLMFLGFSMWSNLTDIIHPLYNNIANAAHVIGAIAGLYWYGMHRRYYGDCNQEW